jgi:formylglycine-generating enzyme required for sulfatase activity
MRLREERLVLMHTLRSHFSLPRTPASTLAVAAWLAFTNVPWSALPGQTAGPIEGTVSEGWFWIGFQTDAVQSYHVEYSTNFISWTILAANIPGRNPSWFTNAVNQPVENVSWSDAADYCARLTAREQSAGRLPPGYVYRLPTEAEWEYACRASSPAACSFGEDTGTSATEDYAVPFRFSDQLHQVTITLKPVPLGDQAKVAQAARQGRVEKGLLD